MIGIRWHSVSGVYDIDFTPENNKYYEFIQNGDKLLIDNELMNEYIRKYNAPEIKGTIPLYMFARNNNGNVDCYTSVKLKEMNIKYSNYEVRRFIPCYSTTTVTDVNGKQCPAGTKGLYDLVEGKFYTNQGNGEDFKAGPDI